MATRRKIKEEDLSDSGLPIWARFTLSMAIALTLVSSTASFLLYKSVSFVGANVQQRTLVDTVQLTAPQVLREIERQRARAEREVFFALETQVGKDASQAARDFTPQDNNPRYESARKALSSYQLGLKDSLKVERELREAKYKELSTQEFWKQVGGAIEHANGAVLQAEVEYGDERRHGVIFKYQNAEGQPPVFLLMPDSTAVSDRNLLGLIAGATFAVILVGVIVSYIVAHQVARPITQIVEDVRQISTGDLEHRTRARAGGEVGVLARAIDRMTKGLSEARENEVELQVRQREVEVATEVREQLLPQSTPKFPGYEVGQLHIASETMGGDFHDYVEIGAAGQGGVGLLVCEVSGRGLPGALVGATARSYLRAKLGDGGDVKAAMQEVNRQLARDVRRGMAVTSLYALIDPNEGIATVACTGHKVPLIRFTGADKKVRLIHPEGIALGFDKGPVFDGKLEIAKVPVDSGDRLVLVNSGAVTIADEDGAELGEKALYALIMRFGALPTESFLAKLREALQTHRGEAGLARDVSVVTISRA